MYQDSLDYRLDEFEDHLNHAVKLIMERYSHLEGSPAFANLSEEEVQAWFDEALPQQGMPIEQVFEKIKQHIMDPATLNIGPNVYAYVMGSGNHVSIIGDLLTSALNQNVAKWHTAPSLTEVEKRIIGWAAELIGLPEHHSGAIVTGGSAANLTGLSVARNIYFADKNIRQTGLFGVKPFTVYASTETHSSIVKSIEQLGIGQQYYRTVPTQADYTIDLEKLTESIERDIAKGFTPFCIIGNAGTVNTGAIDPLSKLSDIASHYRMWFHIDGCYGAAAASLEELKPHYQGIEKADSVALDFHKWLYQPFEIGCVLLKDWKSLRKTFQTPASYLDVGSHDQARFNINEHHFDLSRSGKSLKVWMSFKVYGCEKIKAMIQKDIHMAAYLSGKIAASDEFELVADSTLGISCFRYIGDGHLSNLQLNTLNDHIAEALENDGRIFITPTVLGDQHVMRACVINHRTDKENIDVMFKVITEVSRSVYQKIHPSIAQFNTLSHQYPINSTHPKRLPHLHSRP